MVEVHKIISTMPSFVKRTMAGKKIVVDNQTLNLNSQLLLNNFYKMIDDKICNQTPDQVRSMLDKMVNRFYNEKKIKELCTLSDLSLDCDGVNIPIRIYRPHGISGPMSTLIYYHGGGFVIGTLKMYDYLCAQFCSLCDIQVISVDYRLAPEYKFPIPVTDSIAAYNTLIDNAEKYYINIDKVGVAGDSAGGNLATVVAAELSKVNRTPKFQLLIYPVVKNEPTASFELFKTGFLLEMDDMFWFAHHYIADSDDRTDPLLSPLYFENFDKMPETIMVIAGFDPLRDSNFEYVKKLKDHNVNVHMQLYEEQFHGFYHMPDILPEAFDAVKQSCDTIKEIFKK